MGAPTLTPVAQFLVLCPDCRKPAAAHVDLRGGPRLIRFVCPTGCPVDDGGVLELVRSAAVADAQSTLERAVLV